MPQPRTENTSNNLARLEGSTEAKFEQVEGNITELWSKHGDIMDLVTGPEGLLVKITRLETTIETQKTEHKEDVAGAKKAGLYQAGGVGGIFAIIEILQQAGIIG